MKPPAIIANLAPLRKAFTRISSPQRFEIISILLISTLFVAALYHFFIIRQRMFSHDTIWYYGLMHFFYNCVMQGVFPYWDPYDYCGQPIYYNLGLAHVFEIPTMILIYANKIVNASLLDLYHVDFILRLLVTALGAYLAYRQTLKFALSRIVVFLSFLLSSFTFAAMFQPGLLTSFSWIPWALWFFLRLRGRFDLYNCVGFAFFFGLSLGGYQAGYPLTFFSLLILIVAITDWPWLMACLGDKKKLQCIVVGFILIASLSAHLIPVFLEKDRVLPVMRQVDDPSKSKVELTSVDVINEGAHSRLKDFIGLGVPAVAARAWEDRMKHATSYSEGPLYIGILPIVFAVVGMIFSRHREHRRFLILLGCVVLLMLNVQARLGPGAFFLFPFLRYCRHMQLFQPFFILVLLYFVGQGLDVALDYYGQKGKRSTHT